MRMFVCSTIKGNDMSALVYKSHTIAVYKDHKLTVGWPESFSPYVFGCLKDFMINECYWIFRSMGYPFGNDEFQHALDKAIKDGLVLCDKYMP